MQVHTDLFDLLPTRPEIPHYSYTPSWLHFPVNSKFTWIKIADSNETRISGVAFSALVAKAGTKGAYYHALTSTMQPEAEFRLEKGTYLKPGTFLRPLFPSATDGEISRIADKLMEAIRLRAALRNPTRLLTTNTPSEVYRLPFVENCRSCMVQDDDDEDEKGIDLTQRFRFYDDMPMYAVYSLTEDGEINGRALVYEDVRHVDDPDTPIVAMSRIYAETVDIEAAFKAYAEINNIKYLYRADTAGYFVPIPFDPTAQHYTEVPYVDVFPHVLKSNSSDLPAAYVLASTSPLHLYEQSVSFRRVTRLDNTDGDDDGGIMSVRAPYCEHCDTSFSRSNPPEFYTVDEEDWCEYCFENGSITRCEECGAYTTEYTTDKDGDKYCTSCADRLLSYCQCCDEYVRGDIQAVQTEYGERDWCEDCVDEDAKMCAHCETLYTRNVLQQTDDDVYLCEECYENHAHACDECDAVVYAPDIDPNSDDFLCEKCEHVHNKAA